LNEYKEINDRKMRDSVEGYRSMAKDGIRYASTQSGKGETSDAVDKRTKLKIWNLTNLA